MSIISQVEEGINTSLRNYHSDVYQLLLIKYHIDKI